MRKFLVSLSALCCLMALLFSSCNKGETYAQMKDKEKDAIQHFLQTNHFTGPITVITEDKFKAQEYTTNLQNNEFVLFNDNGIYMQIVSKGVGQTMVEMATAEEEKDSTINKVILCRFLEYDIENGDTVITNLYSPNKVDKMMCEYSHRGRSYKATFTEGEMMSKYTMSKAVPTGWLKPLDYIRLAKSAGQGELAKVRLIVPHSSGTANAGTYVLPMYYEISYQLGR